jgi:hypothetical protein
MSEMPIKIRREFPWLYAGASRVVATPIIGFVTYSYISGSFFQPASELYGLGLTVFGVTAALAGICLTVPESIGGLSQVRHAGEKFLHAGLLVVQSVMLTFVRATIATSPWWIRHPRTSVVGISIAAGLFSLVSAMAAVSWYWAFDDLNRQLWRNYELRMENHHKARD